MNYYLAPDPIPTYPRLNLVLFIIILILFGMAFRLSLNNYSTKNLLQTTDFTLDSRVESRHAPKENKVIPQYGQLDVAVQNGLTNDHLSPQDIGVVTSQSKSYALPIQFISKIDGKTMEIPNYDPKELIEDFQSAPGFGADELGYSPPNFPVYISTTQPIEVPEANIAIYGILALGILALISIKNKH